MYLVGNIISGRFRVNHAHPTHRARKQLLRRQALLLAPYSKNSLFLLCATTVTTLIVSFLAVGLYRNNLPRVDAKSSNTVLAQLSRSLNNSQAREAAILQINQQQERQLASQVHYISEIVEKQRTRHAGAGVPAKNIAAAIVSESSRHGFDPFFIASVIKYESTFNTLARSPAGALGLMQVLPSTGHYISKASGIPLKSNADLHNPILNVRVGVAYLAKLRKLFRGNKEQMLIAYNWGPDNLLKALNAGRPAPHSTASYARRVISHFQESQRSFAALQSRYKHFDFARVITQEKTFG